MARIAVGGFQHETNTFAPSKADYAAFEAGGGWPAAARSATAIAPRSPAPTFRPTGAIEALRAPATRTVGLAWGAATPSAQVTKDAFERIVGEIVERSRTAGPVDGVYLDLHGAMVTEHLDDGEGEILRARARASSGRACRSSRASTCTPTSRARCSSSRRLVAYRTYPHVDMAETGARAARLLDAHAARGAAAGEARCARSTS